MNRLMVGSLVRTLHNVFTVIWLGGIFTSAISLIPTLKTLGKGSELQEKLLKEFAKKQRRWVYISFVVLAITGIMLSKRDGRSSGLFDFSNKYAVLLSVKHIFVFLMMVLSVVRAKLLIQKERLKKIHMKASFVILFVNVLLALGILFISSMNASMI